MTIFGLLSVNKGLNESKFTIFTYSKQPLTQPYIFFNLFFILLYNVVFVLPYIDLNPSWVYVCSPS